MNILHNPPVEFIWGLSCIASLLSIAALNVFFNHREQVNYVKQSIENLKGDSISKGIEAIKNEIEQVKSKIASGTETHKKLTTMLSETNSKVEKIDAGSIPPV